MEPSSSASREVRPVTAEDKGTDVNLRGHELDDCERGASTEAVKGREAEAEVGQTVI